MKQETLKQIVELAEGFEYVDEFAEFTIIETPGMQVIHLNQLECDDWRYELYPLLLRRAVEGWKDNLDDLINTQNYQKTDYLTPQEQAIEVCLIELLEG
jgi:hypothetical protein